MENLNRKSNFELLRIFAIVLSFLMIIFLLSIYLCYPIHTVDHYLKEQEKIINNYIKNKQKRKSKSVVYTVITNDYDSLEIIQKYQYINPDWDYVCYTDNKKYIEQGHVGIWEIRPIVYTKLDPVRNQRWHKLHPHLLLPDYDESIYIDANIDILSDFLFKTIRKRNKDFLVPKHFKNKCIYEEYQDILLYKFDTPEIIYKELDFIKEAKMPRNKGFLETNILYRKHNNPKIILMMNQWWDMVEKYSKRDQLSFTYILWKNNYDIHQMEFDNARLRKNDFLFRDHLKPHPL
ncbi:MAG: DUF616 domain-containing protein [Alphaproteobacteria bacterium]|nr:DUF616 domain-containing protein [Alphaproteobacteria bacterium]